MANHKTIKDVDGNLIEIYAEVKAKTEKAYMISDGDIEAWVPLSHIENIELLANGVWEIVIPEWLAQEKGFI